MKTQDIFADPNLVQRPLHRADEDLALILELLVLRPEGRLSAMSAARHRLFQGHGTTDPMFRAMVQLCSKDALEEIVWRSMLTGEAPPYERVVQFGVQPAIAASRQRGPVRHAERQSLGAVGDAPADACPAMPRQTH